MKREPRVLERTGSQAAERWTLGGLIGPSGSGKTDSALRVATGLSKVLQRKVAVIDTEAGRSLHYRQFYDFDHYHMGAPFGSLDYLDVLKQVHSEGAGIIVVDSASHEHEGDRGYLHLHEIILDEMREQARKRGDDRSADWQLDDRNNRRAWIEPQRNRDLLILGMTQLRVHLILNYRAKLGSEQIKSQKGGRERTEIVDLGWVPIAGYKLVYESTWSAILDENAPGVPRWTESEHGKRKWIKRPRYLASVFDDYRGDASLDVVHGERLARWAIGEALPAAAGGGDERKARESDPTETQGTQSAAADPVHLEAVEAVRALFKATGRTKFVAMLEFAKGAGVDEKRFAACWSQGALHLDRLTLDELTLIVDHGSRSPA